MNIIFILIRDNEILQKVIQETYIKLYKSKNIEI